MGSRRLGAGFVLLGVLAASALILFAAGSLWSPTPLLPDGRYEVPSLTIWGKVLSFLLLTALGVASFAWRRPVLHAQAILETSPLGSGHCCGSLVDWRLLAKTAVAVEILAMVGVWLVAAFWRPLSTTDALGVLGAGAIVAFVIHLLALHCRPGGGESRS